MSPRACLKCGDTAGPFVRHNGRLICEDCADKQKGGGK